MTTPKLTDVMPWSRLGIVGGTFITVLTLGLSHYHHVAIVTKVAADSSPNWAVANTELLTGLVSALVTAIAGWRATKGMTHVQLTTVHTVVSVAEETSDVLLQKLGHCLRLEAAEAARASIMKGGTV